MGTRVNTAAMIMFLTGALAATAQDAVVWSTNPCVAIFEGPDYSDGNDPNAVVRVVGARNGWFTGQVVMFSKTPQPCPAVKADELKSKEGGVIPASNLQISYALPSNTEGGAEKRVGKIKNLRRFDALQSTPPDKPTATQPIWIKIRVPADAKAGAYEGKLTVGSRTIPIQLSVADWTLPDPTNYVTFVDLIQSPETVALFYNTEMWSDKHFETIGRSFEWLAQIGNKTVYIPLICKTHFGNSETMVRWIGDPWPAPVVSTNAAEASQAATAGPMPSYEHDFTIAEKYLDVYLQKVGKPQVVCFYLWDYFAGGSYFNKGDRKSAPIPVSRLDKATGKVEMMNGPPHATPESEAFWKPVMDGLHERLAKRGLGDETFMIGVAGDSRPSKEVIGMFKKIAPWASWVVHSHGAAKNLAGVPVGYLAHVWGVGTVPDPDKGDKRGQKVLYGWNENFTRTVFPRYGGGGFILNPPLWANAPLAVHRCIGEATLAANLRGFGRIGADFWGALAADKGAKRSLLNRYPESQWHQLTVGTATAEVLYPGPDGALSTVRFEMLREGVQEAEAKIFIEKALLNKDLRAKIGDESAAKMEEFLKERIRAFRTSFPPDKNSPDNKGWEWFAAESGWQDRDEKLFATAAEVAKAAGK